MLGAIVSWVTIVPLGIRLIEAISLGMTYREQGVLAVVLWTVVAVVTAGAAGFAVHVEFRDSLLRRRLTRSAVLGLLISGAAVVAPTIAFASAAGFSTASGVVVQEAAMVIAALVIGLAVAGELTWRRLEPRLTRR